MNFDAGVLIGIVHALLTPLNGIYPILATKYMGEKSVIRARRKAYGGKIQTRSYSPIEILLHIGAPNYAERQFIAKCKKAREPFPVAKIQIKFEKVTRKAKAA